MRIKEAADDSLTMIAITVFTVAWCSRSGAISKQPFRKFHLPRVRMGFLKVLKICD